MSPAIRHHQSALITLHDIMSMQQVNCQEIYEKKTLPPLYLYRGSMLNALWPPIEMSTMTTMTFAVAAASSNQGRDKTR